MSKKPTTPPQLTTEQKAAVYDKLLELMSIDDRFVAIQATVNGKQCRAHIGVFGRFCVNTDHYPSFMDMLEAFEGRVRDA